MEGVVSAPSKSLNIEVHATATHHHERLEPKVAHAQSHEFSHSQAVSFILTLSDGTL